MSVSYVKFMKHAAKVTKGVSKMRPILGGVCHYEDGAIAVTDSHRLYFAPNSYKTSTQVVKSPTTGEVIVGNYPEIRKLIPTEGEKFEVDMNVTETLNALKAMALVKEEKLVRMTVESHDFMIKVQSPDLQVAFNAGGIQSKENQDDANMLVNKKYLIEIFEMLKDIGVITATLKSFGNLRPITIGNDTVTALVLPCKEPNK